RRLLPPHAARPRCAAVGTRAAGRSARGLPPRPSRDAQGPGLMPGFFTDRWCSLLLRLYPQRFRSRFEEGMRDALWRDHELARSNGTAAVAAFWVLTSIDAVRFGCAERRPQLRGGFSMRAL